MLLNVSNHPSTQWPPAQSEAAIAQYGEVQDLPFPAINPNWSHDQVLQEAESYEAQVRSIDPTAVHIMGELTFTYALVQKLLSAGIPCIASTTERRVTIAEDGTKTSHFQFIAFRPY